jgi:mono/diheme cytochrome c family protein
MSDQPRCEPLEKSTFFQDERCSRHLVAGTVPRGALRDDPILFTGQMSEASAATGERGPAAGQDEETNQTDQQEGNQSGETAIPGGGEEGQQGGQQAAQANQNLADAFPFAVTLDVLEVGQERYNIYCAPCHDRAGTGNGMIVRRGFAQPPSLHIDRLRDAPVGHYFDVITNGWGAMPSYSAQVPVRDRWAIIAYIRALQLSQNASIEDVPADARDQLEGGEQQQ